MIVSKRVPLKQGLKRLKKTRVIIPPACLKESSIKTRIETKIKGKGKLKPEKVSKRVPLKQGLKLAPLKVSMKVDRSQREFH